MAPKIILHWLIFTASILAVILCLMVGMKAKWKRQYIAVFYPALVIFSFVLNLALLKDKKSEVWKIERRSGPELYRTLIDTPDEWGLENSVYYFMNEYLKGKVLITYSRDIFVQRTFELRVFPKKVEVMDYQHYLSQGTVQMLREKPFYIEGRPGSNQTFFVMGEDYEESGEIYLFKGDEMFFMVPSSCLKSVQKDGDDGVGKK